MSDLRSETEAAAEAYVRDFHASELLDNQQLDRIMHAFKSGATQGPPLLRALEALNRIKSDTSANNKLLVEHFKQTAKEALLEIEAARGSGEK